MLISSKQDPYFHPYCEVRALTKVETVTTTRYYGECLPFIGVHYTQLRNSDYRCRVALGRAILDGDFSGSYPRTTRC